MAKNTSVNVRTTEEIKKGVEVIHFALPTWQGKNNTRPKGTDNLSAGVSTSG